MSLCYRKIRMVESIMLYIFPSTCKLKTQKRCFLICRSYVDCVYWKKIQCQQYLMMGKIVKQLIGSGHASRLRLAFLLVPCALWFVLLHKPPLCVMVELMRTVLELFLNKCMCYLYTKKKRHRLSRLQLHPSVIWHLLCNILFDAVQFECQYINHK